MAAGKKYSILYCFLLIFCCFLLIFYCFLPIISIFEQFVPSVLHPPLTNRQQRLHQIEFNHQHNTGPKASNQPESEIFDGIGGEGDGDSLGQRQESSRMG